jgi:hypothetical protein
MTHDELLAAAVDRLRKVEGALGRAGDKVSALIRRLKVDEMPLRTIRDAVVIQFEAHDDRGRIEVVMDSQTGEMIGHKYLPPIRNTDDTP